MLWCGKDEKAEKVIRNKANEIGAPMLCVDRSSLKIKKTTLCGTTFDFANREGIQLSLLGTYQPINATNCLTAIEILTKNGFNIPEAAIYEGLKTVKWQARFEVINKSPLVIADGGHNPEGIDSAVASIKQYFGEEKVGIITGVMADKDYNYMADRIASVAEKVFCLTPDNPRALSAERYAKVFADKGISSVACDSVPDAVDAAVAWARENGKPIISLGSLYMYCEVAEAIKKYN